MVKLRDRECLITKAEYFEDYKLFISFFDGVSNIFDFKNLVTSDREEYRPYLDITKFKKFKIARNKKAIAWGKENDMQIPDFMLYSLKRAPKGWYINETFDELKKRLHNKYYYEMFVDNSVWGRIHVLLDLLPRDKNLVLFSRKFHNGTDDKSYSFEVFNAKFHISIKLYPLGLVYKLVVNEIGSTTYKVNFENEPKGKRLTGKRLEKYEQLFDAAWKLIEKNRKSVITKFEVIK